MARELLDGVYWVSECSETPSGQHMHIGVYVIESETGFILIDTGSHTHQEPLRKSVESVTGDAGVEAIVISHPDLPHSGNVRHFQEIWDDPKIIASVGTPAVVGLPERTRATIGSKTTVLGRPVTFVDPPLADVVFSTWPYDHETGVLFSIDGFGTYHPPDECDGIVDDESSIPSTEEIATYHSDTFRWLEYVDPEKFQDSLADPFDEFDVSFVAPAHGHPIAAPYAEEYLERLQRAVAGLATPSV